MRMSSWTPEIIRFMDDASENTTYFRTLASLATRGLESGALVCDAGCGMGQLAFEMARLGFSVDALDKSEDAIEQARRRAERLEMNDVRIRRADFLEGDAAYPPYDRMVFCLSASVVDAVAVARKNGARSLLVVNKVHQKMSADRTIEAPQGKGGKERPIVHNVACELEKLANAGIACEANELSLDFGQPFRTLEEAARYFELFRTKSYPGGVTLDRLESLLQKRPQGDFSYYLPVIRHLVVFDVDIAARATAGFQAAPIVSAHRATCQELPHRRIA